MQSYLNHGLRSSQTPQSEPIPGSSQIANNAGGYSWQLDELGRLKRFLILGSEGGTYYVAERELTKQNLAVVERMLKAGQGHLVVRTISEISQAGRAAKNDPALFALARCASADDPEVRHAAFKALPAVARTGTHLLHFVHYAKQFRGWGRAYKRAIAEWYEAKSVRDLAYQAVKYQSRDGYSQRDLLRLAHPKTDNEARNILYHWIVRGWDAVGEEPHPIEDLQLVWAFERAKRFGSAEEIVKLIRQYRLPREAIPTQHLQNVAIWEALLEEMPMEAMTRNLATMTRVGLLKPMGKATMEIMTRLGNEERIRKARLHPIKLLAALMTYASGKSVRGDSTWQPLREITDALNMAFYLSFGAVEPTRKRLVLALDVSGSMNAGAVAGVPNLTPRVASSAMAMVTAAVEQQYSIMAFSGNFIPLNISPKQRLDDIVRVTNGLPFNSTDCSLPMLWALKEGVEADAFIIYTDSETWAGRMHPVQALRLYREKTGIPARLVVVGMTSNGFSIADPNDSGMLDVVGFDTNTPQVISDFVRGEL